MILTKVFAPAELIEPRLSLGIPHDVSRFTVSGIIWTEDKLITIIRRVSGAPQEAWTRTGIILVRILQVLHKFRVLKRGISVIVPIELLESRGQSEPARLVSLLIESSVPTLVIRALYELEEVLESPRYLKGP